MRGSNVEDESSKGDAPEAPPKPRRSRSASDFYRMQPVRNRHIHVLGMGSVGTFIAHSLRGIPHPPEVTLLYHRWAKLKKWEEGPRQLRVITDGSPEKREGFTTELTGLRARFHGKEVGLGHEEGDASPSEGESSEPIHSLIVCTKAHAVLQALSSVKQRLHKDSVILFLQNGMGTVEEVNKAIFPDPETRPYYMVGINSHGVHDNAEAAFTVTHAGFGTLSVGFLPHERERAPAPYEPTPKFGPHVHNAAPVTPRYAATPDAETPAPSPTTFRWTPNHRYLLRTLLRTPVLCATAFSPPDLLQLQLEKLAVNCIINPLTVMLDARNGAILYNYALTRTMRLLLSEISLVVRSLPELQHIPNVQQRFDPGRLETMVVGVAHKSRDNISSMLADVRNGGQTEIDYINGWIVRKGEEQGMRCLTNYMLANLVKGKGNMIQLELSEGLPFVGAKDGEDGADGVRIKGSIAKSAESDGEAHNS